MIKKINDKPLVSKEFVVQLISYGVLLNGLILITSTLLGELIFRNIARSNPFDINMTILIGFSLVYLALLLRRRKKAAWNFVVPLYAFIFIYNILYTFVLVNHHHFTVVTLIRNFILPFVVVIGLILARKDFVVRSDIRSFTLSIRYIAVIMTITLLFGIFGFQLLDNKDFHTEISFNSAIHHTIDQFDFTTNQTLTPYTKRAKVFLDSLNIISIAALIYIAISLFKPLRFRFNDEEFNRNTAQSLLEDYQSSSEDFFKLWPHDKSYYFNDERTAGIAFHVQNGVALAVGDPMGDKKAFGGTLLGYLELCRVNDWLPAFVHVETESLHLYKKNDLSMQKIGEEAVVSIDAFKNNVMNNKYFRQIRNKFDKQGYSTEMLFPPHNQAIINRLTEVNKDWLTLPGRSERGFMMGYFTPEYLQLCPIMVVRDAAGTIQAFINQIPSYAHGEANYDFLRQTKQSLGNTNDYLLMNFLLYLSNEGYERLNMGLCPLAGINDEDADKTIIDKTLQFVYSNGDRFYSFSGLHKFKAKYEPEWSNRYIIYKGGIRNFTRAINALNKAMSKTKKNK
ncbi:MAG: hypothetical protein NVSMB46_01450 [Candidatus Saccharimonadales bacterium]